MTDPAQRQRLEPVDSAALAAAVRAAAPDRFADGFHDRVLARLRAQRNMPLAVALERQFLRIVPLAAAAAILLAAYNWWGGRQQGASTLDAALNLPQVTLSSAYAPATLYGATIASTAAEGQ